MIRLDITYARYMSFWWDVRIMIRTPGAIFKQMFQPKPPARPLVIESVRKLMETQSLDH
jgi:hypothetical protein